MMLLSLKQYANCLSLSKALDLYIYTPPPEQVCSWRSQIGFNPWFAGTQALNRTVLPPEIG